jgi:hypothetical protein
MLNPSPMVFPRYGAAAQILKRLGYEPEPHPTMPRHGQVLFPNYTDYDAATRLVRESAANASFFLGTPTKLEVR